MINNWRFWHLGVAVRDLDSSLFRFRDLGIGPFEEPRIGTTTEKTVHGKPATGHKTLASLAALGNVNMEVLQPVSGQSLQQEWLDNHGEGLSHVAFLVDDVAAETAELENKGVEVLARGQFAEGGGFAFFNLDKVGGLVIELVQMPARESK